MNIKEMLNSGVRTLIEKYHSEKVLNTFLIHVLEDSKKYYNHKKNPKVLEAQNRVIELLGDLLLGKKVSKGELKSAADAAYNVAYAAYYDAASAASAAYVAASAASAAYVAASAAYAAIAAYYAAYNDAKEREYKNYLIELILRENNIDTKTFNILYVRKSL